MTPEPGKASGLWNRNTTKVIIMTVLIALLLLLAVLGIRRLMPGANDIRASVSARVFTTADSIFFRDATGFAKDHRWTFGDNTQSFSAQGYHRYTAPGNYVIRLTINGSFTDTFLVTVHPVPPVIPVQDSVVFIEGPVQGMQLENLVFRAKGLGASQYRWKFGETDFIDSKEPFVQYAYQQPGDYTVLLYTNNSEYPTRHTIKILPSFQTGNADTFSIDDMYRQYEDDFRYHLQEIANGSSFNTHYYYLLKKYLCNNERTVVKIGDKINDYNSHCLGLQFDEGVTIQSVKLTPQPDLKCMKLVEVKQVKTR